MTFDPNAAAPPGSGIFGLPFTSDEAAILLLPVPWEATTSYGAGTARGPAAIAQASRQLDLADLELDRPYQVGICLLPEPDGIRAWNERARGLAEPIIAAGGADDGAARASLDEVNRLSAAVNDRVRHAVEDVLAAGRIPGVLGGDHSVPLGAFEAAARHGGAFGILHFDAHSDTRRAFGGFTFSHASIMRNALERIPEVSRLVQVGVRDFCDEELGFLASQGDRVRTYFDGELQRRRFSGEPWDRVVEDIVAALPGDVWISFDIDGLDPALCPHTGTPVPGGLDFAQAEHVLRAVALSGRRIIGFDLDEVAPGPDPADEWDANVGMRLLYRLCAWTACSRGLLRFLPGRGR